MKIPPCTFDKIREKHSHSLTLRAKVKVKQKSKANALGKKHASQKNLSRGSLSNWCDADAEANADADTDISETICQPPPYGGGST